MKAGGRDTACSKQRSSQKFPKLNDVPTNVLQEKLRTDILKFLRTFYKTCRSPICGYIIHLSTIFLISSPLLLYLRAAEEHTITLAHPE